MAKPDLSPEQRRSLAEDFTEELASPESVRRRMVDGARLRRELPPGGSAEVRRTRIGPGPSGEVLSTRIGPGPSGNALDTRIGGPEVADYFQFRDNTEEIDESIRPVRTHELPLDIDPQTTEEA